SLGGNRGGRWKTYRNLMATMTLGGLWHGAAWNFALWGLYQGGLLSIHRIISGTHKRVGEGTKRSVMAWAGRVLMIAVFFQVVCYGWLLFRAGSFAQIVDFTGRLFTGAPGLTIPDLPIAAYLGIAFLLVWDILTEWTGNTRFYQTWPLLIRAGIYAGMLYLLAFGATTATSAFIYFQF
ncbi:MAG: hypothetical protein ACK5II_08990, partial [Paracoccus sp. (in: a-proteobacteria)]